MSIHTYNMAFFHIVWSTKNREPYLNDNIRQRVHKYICGIAKRKNLCLICVGGINDHVHILLKINTHEIFLSDIARVLKTNSSKFIRDNFIQNFEWQRGYSSFAVDAVCAPRIIKYILNQEKHHEKVSFEDELNYIVRRYNSL
ncbi:IS200/IS605 family transposase [Candidatus Babeliales bacterium]|nr:IS200/IS605 family transposase [Candidatus Babeliales bacterium]